MNSRLALETGELVRDRAGDAAFAAFHHAVSRAFFVDGADIADPALIAAQAAAFGVGDTEVRDAWTRRAYASAIEASMRDAFAAGVSGVPAFGWPGSPAVSGMMEPGRMVAILQTRAP